MWRCITNWVRPLQCLNIAFHGQLVSHRICVRPKWVKNAIIDITEQFLLTSIPWITFISTNSISEASNSVEIIMYISTVQCSFWQGQYYVKLKYGWEINTTHQPHPWNSYCSFIVWPIIYQPIHNTVLKIYYYLHDAAKSERHKSVVLLGLN